MSISKIRKSFDSKGCQVVLVVIGLFLAIGLLYSGTCQGLTGQGQQDPTNVDVVVIGGKAVKAQDLDRAVRVAQEAAMERSGGMTDPASDFYTVGGAIDGVLRRTVIQSMLDQRGTQVTDEDVRQGAARQIEQQIDMLRMQVQMGGVLKPDSTEADFDKWFKESNGQSVADFRKAAMGRIDEGLKDPARAVELRQAFLQDALLAAYVKESTLTEADLRQSFDQFTFKVLRFKDADSAARTKKAEGALAEIRGGAKADDVAKKRLGKAAESMPLARGTLNTVTYLKGLADLKVGEAGDVVQEPDSASVFVVESIAPKPPENYDKERQKLLEGFRQREAGRKLEADIEAVLKGDRVEWKVPVLKDVYDAYQAVRTGFGQDTKERSELLLGIYERLTATSESATGSSWVALARYNIYQQYYFTLSPKEQAEKRAEWIECVVGLLDFREDVRLRMDLAQLYADEEDFVQAGEQLALAAEANTDTGPAGTALTGQLKTKLELAKKSGKYEKETLAKVEKTLAAWAEAKAQDAREAAEAAKEQEKVAAELDKLSEEEAAKDKPKSEAPSGDR